ncbi:exodeoxyribonuclease X C-terminal domain-containing protein [Paenibacillus massiliensis]
MTFGKYKGKSVHEVFS